MISFEEAVGTIKATAAPLGTERIRLEQAHRRVIAEPVLARIDSPRCDVSAMDGFAIREADLSALPARLRIVGEAFAGCEWSGTVGAGECVRIFTGAPVPPGADRVVIQENVERDGDFALIRFHPGHARHVRRRAGDFAAGTQLVGRGRVLDARAIVAAAAADAADVAVYRRPRVRILSTGDELAEPGTAHRTADAIPESVSFGVAALASDWGAEVCGRIRLRDELEQMKRASAEASEGIDLVVVTGGASVGEKDFAKTMFEPLGLDLVFSKVAMKPGKPVWLGQARELLVIGLPGNPTSALVTARLFLAPLLAALGGRKVEEALRWRKLPLARPLDPCGARETFHRARLMEDGVTVLENQDSSAQKALVGADILVRQRANSPANAVGEPVESLDF